MLQKEIKTTALTTSTKKVNLLLCTEARYILVKKQEGHLSYPLLPKFDRRKINMAQVHLTVGWKCISALDFSFQCVLCSTSDLEILCSLTVKAKRQFKVKKNLHPLSSLKCENIKNEFFVEFKQNHPSSE